MIATPCGEQSPQGFFGGYMLYIVRVFEGSEVFEYEYGNLRHAQEHLSFERCSAELYEWQKDTETLICTVNSNN